MYSINNNLYHPLEISCFQTEQQSTQSDVFEFEEKQETPSESTGSISDLFKASLAPPAFPKSSPIKMSKNSRRIIPYKLDIFGSWKMEEKPKNKLTYQELVEKIRKIPRSFIKGKSKVSHENFQNNPHVHEFKIQIALNEESANKHLLGYVESEQQKVVLRIEKLIAISTHNSSSKLFGSSKLFLQELKAENINLANLQLMLDEKLSDLRDKGEVMDTTESIADERTTRFIDFKDEVQCFQSGKTSPLVDGPKPVKCKKMNREDSYEIFLEMENPTAEAFMEIFLPIHYKEKKERIGSPVLHHCYHTGLALLEQVLDEASKGAIIDYDNFMERFLKEELRLGLLEIREEEEGFGNRQEVIDIVNEILALYKGRFKTHDQLTRTLNELIIQRSRYHSYLKNIFNRIQNLCNKLEDHINQEYEWAHEAFSHLIDSA